MSAKSKSKGGKKPTPYSNIEFNSYVIKIVGSLNADHGIGRRAAWGMSELILYFVSRVGAATRELLNNATRQTVKVNLLSAALQVVLPGSLYKSVHADAMKAAHAFAPKSAGMPRKGSSGKAKAGPSRSNAAKAGIILPPRRTMRALEAHIGGKGVRKSGVAAVFLAAAAESLARHILRGAIAGAADTKRKRVIPRHILLAIRADAGLNSFFHHVTLAGGVVPHIHAELQHKKGKKSAEASASPEM